MQLLDRYVLKNFLLPFAYSFFGFLAIWLIFDLADNSRDFIEAHASLLKVGYFYVTQLPQVMTVSLPVGILLALLYSLSRMSRSNEIISMLTAGRSIPRIILPLVLCGIAASGLSMVLNYKWAPRADLMKKQILEQLVRGKSAKDVVEGQLFRNRSEFRTWYAQRISVKKNELVGVHVTQQDADGGVQSKYYALRAAYLPDTKTWVFFRGMRVDFNADGDIVKQETWLNGMRKFTGWSETPWRISSANIDAQNLTVPELRQYLRGNFDFPDAQLAPYRTYLSHRQAVPWACLIVVFVAAPLGIVYSRRGVLAGVASSIFIFFGMIFLTNLFLALGRGNRISPFLAGWLPNIAVGLLGVFLLWLRASNRELPTLKSFFVPKPA
jgi:lipopolysaccharide export system permease protein